MRNPVRHRIAAALRRSGPPIAALSAVAVSQPVLDLFGRNPEFFVAKSLGRAEVVAFGAVIAIGLPLLLIAAVSVAASVSERVGRAAHVAIVATLAGAFSLVLLGRDQTSIAVGVVLAVAVGAIAVHAERTYDGFRTALRYLSALPVLVLALFVFGSETARLVWAPAAAAAPAEVVASPAPVSVLVFDELPLASLLTEDGTINAERFPNFARLADSGTWYRNATSPYPRTEAAVPAILSGTVGPLGRIPSTIDYPRNLFTMLADSHAMNVEQEVTALCPEYACGAPQTPGTTLERSVDSLTDAAVVYGHRTLPEPARDSLPPVNQSWGGFTDGAEGNAQNPFASRRDDPKGTQTQVGKLAYFDRMIAAIDDGPRPALNVAHGVFPHSPWSLTPTGNAYGSVTEGLDFEPRLVWTDDAEVVLHGQIQHLMQLGVADAALGRLIDRLEETGQWDDSLVAVVADHGAAFEPGGQNREPSADNLDEVFRVPFFVKYPDQTGGTIDDEPAQVTDLVPTIADALDVETSWEFDGRSLLDEDRPDVEPTAVLRDGSSVDLDPSVESLLDLARRNHERFPYRDDWLGVVAIGDAGAHVGEPATALDLVEGPAWTWSTDRWAAFDDVGDGFVPIQFDGTVEGPTDAGEPDEFLVAVNGTVAGVGTRISPDGDGRWAFSTIVAEELFTPGANTVELYAPAAGRPDTWVKATGARDASITVLTDASGSPTAVERGDEKTAVGPSDHRQVVIEAAFTDGRTIVVDGWAADTEADREPIDIALIVDGERVSTGVEPYPALAEPEGGLARWGFRLSIPDSGVSGTTGVVIAVFDDIVIAVPVDWSA